MLTSWCRWALVERGLSPSTVKGYERALRALRAHAGGELAALREPELRLSLHGRAEGASTTASRIAAYRSYYGWLVRTGQRADDPTAFLDRPKVRRGLPRPVADLERRLGMLDPELRAVAVFLAETGLRVSEACAIDVHLPAPTELVVRGKGSKERLVPLTEAAREALEVLGGRVHFSARTIQRRFAEVGFTPHMLRHSLATALIESGADIVDVQKILGHASPATTTIYSAYSTRRLRSALERRRSE